MARLAFAILAAWVAQASSADVAKTSLRSPAAELDNASRRLSYERIANYAPRSLVTDHNAIDLDQKLLELALADETSSGFLQAKSVYRNGGNSKSIARVRLPTALTNVIPERSDFIGQADDNDEINLTLLKDAERGSIQLFLQYSRSEVQESLNLCRVGGLESSQIITNGCLKGSGEIKMKSNDQTFRYTYWLTTDNYNGRTLQYFSTELESKMLTCSRCPYKDAKMFTDYYGQADYANEWILAALDGRSTNFSYGNADFSMWGYAGRRECVQKATAYMSVFMFALRSFEAALDSCVQSDSIGALHSWDKGVAYYTGSTEEQTGAPTGYLMHELADKCCMSFRTCGPSGGLMQSDTSRVNHNILTLFNEGQDQVDNLSCAAAQQTKEAIADLMYIPLVQSTLRYAYKIDKEQGGEKEQAEGAVFAAAVLPVVHAHDPSAAQIIYDNMKVGATSTDVNLVKEAFESVYRQMGIGCEEIGGIINFTGEYLNGMQPCTASDDGTRGNDNDDRNKGNDNDEGTGNDNDKGGDNDEGNGADNDMSKGGDDDDDKIVFVLAFVSLSGVLCLSIIGILMFIRGHNRQDDIFFGANATTPSIT